jgi:integrase
VIHRNPIRKIPRTPHDAQSRRGQRVLNIEQYKTLKAACKTSAELALIRIATECCLRQGELTALRWSDIDFDNFRIDVSRRITQTKATGKVEGPRKGGRPARPAMLADLAQLLRDLQVESIAKHGAAPDDPVWPGRGTRGEPYDRSAVRSPHSVGQLVRRIIERAGLVDGTGRTIVSLHDLRRTGMSLADACGVPESIIQAQAGQAPGSRVTRRHYLRRPDESMQDQFSEAFTRQSP